MSKETKNKKKVVVDFMTGYATLPNGKEKPLYIDKKGVWFRKGIKSIILTEANCMIL